MAEPQGSYGHHSASMMEPLGVATNIEMRLHHFFTSSVGLTSVIAIHQWTIFSHTHLLNLMDEKMFGMVYGMSLVLLPLLLWFFMDHLLQPFYKMANDEDI